VEPPPRSGRIAPVTIADGDGLGPADPATDALGAGGEGVGGGVAPGGTGLGVAFTGGAGFGVALTGGFGAGFGVGFGVGFGGGGVALGGGGVALGVGFGVGLGGGAVITTRLGAAAVRTTVSCPPPVPLVAVKS
jgi:hypothetical protein